MLENMRILERDGIHFINKEGDFDIKNVEKRQKIGNYPLAKDVLKKLNEFVEKYPDTRIDTECICELWFTTNKELGEFHEIGIVTSHFYDTESYEKDLE